MLLEALLTLGFCMMVLLVVWLANRTGSLSARTEKAEASLDHIAKEKADEAANAPRFDSMFDRVRAKRRK